MGIVVCVDGERERLFEEEGGRRFGKERFEGREGGSIRPGVGREEEVVEGRGFNRGGPRALWAEFKAGKEGGGRSSSSSESSLLCEREKVGTVGVEFGSRGEVEVDVDGEEGALEEIGFLNSGGGGIALRSNACLSVSIVVVITGLFSSSSCVGKDFFGVEGSSWEGRVVGASSFLMAISWMEGRRSHRRNDHEDGGCR